MMFFIKIFAMFLSLIIIVCSIWTLKSGTGINPNIFFLEPTESASFDPAKVTHFEWKSTKKIFSYDRDNHGKWLPQKNEKKLRELFSFLSQIQLSPVEQKGKSSLEVVLDIEGVRWMGAWDGLSFVWKQGPKAGMGEILKEQKNIMFFKGAYIFDDFDINFCKNRIAKIYMQAFGKNFQISQIDRGWKVVSPEEQVLDPIFMEKWLIGLCKVKLKSLLDLSYAPSNTKQGAVTFEFVDGEKLSLMQVEGDFFVTQEMGMLLQNLNPALDELKKQFTPKTNP